LVLGLMLGSSDSVPTAAEEATVRAALTPERRNTWKNFQDKSEETGICSPVTTREQKPGLVQIVVLHNIEVERGLRQQGEVGVIDFILLCIDLYEATIGTWEIRAPLHQMTSINHLTTLVLKKYRRGGATNAQHTAYCVVALTRFAKQYLLQRELHRLQQRAAAVDSPR
jgi:hypothetical protein